MPFNIIGAALGGLAGAAFGGSGKKPKEDPLARAIRLYLERLLKDYGPGILNMLVGSIQDQSAKGVERPKVIKRPLTATEQLGHLYAAQGAGARHRAAGSQALDVASERLGFQRPLALLQTTAGLVNPQIGLQLPDVSSIYAQAALGRQQDLSLMAGLMAPYIRDWIQGLSSGGIKPEQAMPYVPETWI